jgi:hypothetical protein
MTTDKILDKLGNKSFHNNIASFVKTTAADQITIETRWTDFVQNLIDFGNNHILSNFRYRLIMEDDED